MSEPSPGNRIQAAGESMRIYPRVVDLEGYEASKGTARNGSSYVTLRHDRLSTMTAFGAAAEALSEALGRGGSVRVDSYERSGTIKVVTIACPLTGLPIGENGRLEPVPVAPEFSVVPTPEPEGLWGRMVDAVQDMLGIDDDRPEPQPVLISPGKTGYPFVDAMMDDIRKALLENPNLTDSNGGRFDLTIEKHLPALAAQHAETVRGATPQETRLADAMLSEGLKVTRTSFEAAQADHRSMKLDALAIQMNFLRSRQGMDATFEPQLSIEEQPRALKLAAPGISTLGLQAKQAFLVSAREADVVDAAKSVERMPFSGAKTSRGPSDAGRTKSAPRSLESKGPRTPDAGGDPHIEMQRRMIARRGLGA